MKPDFDAAATRVWSCEGYMHNAMVDAIRAAYTAGLERAAEIADEAIIVAVEVHGNFPKGAACSELSAAIRAAKENDNG